MDEKRIIEKLVDNFGLSKNESDVLTALVGSKLTAREILKKTMVSNGRIYRVLNGLEKQGLVVKSAGKEAAYELGSWRERVEAFFKFKTKEIWAAQAEIREELGKKEEVRVEVRHGSREDYDGEIINLFAGNQRIQIIHKHESVPWFLYLWDEKEFWQYRQEVAIRRTIGSSDRRGVMELKREAYLKLYQEKEVEQIMGLETWEEIKREWKKLFGRKNQLIWEEGVRERLKESGGRVKIWLMPKMFTPFSVYIADREVLMPMFFKDKKSRMVVMGGREIVDIYGDYFERYREEARNLLEI